MSDKIQTAITKQIFFRFLKENNCFKQYLKNCLNEELKELFKGLNTVKIYSNHPEIWIGYSFDFRKSPEGLKFWGDLNSIWHNFCRSQKFKKQWKK